MINRCSHTYVTISVKTSSSQSITKRRSYCFCSLAYGYAWFTASNQHIVLIRELYHCLCVTSATFANSRSTGGGKLSNFTPSNLGHTKVQSASTFFMIQYVGPVCQPKPEPTDFEITYKSGQSGERICRNQIRLPTPRLSQSPS